MDFFFITMAIQFTKTKPLLKPLRLSLSLQVQCALTFIYFFFSFQGWAHFWQSLLHHGRELKGKENYPAKRLNELCPSRCAHHFNNANPDCLSKYPSESVWLILKISCCHSWKKWKNHTRRQQKKRLKGFLDVCKVTLLMIVSILK